MTGVLVVGDVMNDVIVLPAGAAVDSDIAAEIAPVPGGSGANQAAWLASLGVPVRLAARVGAVDAELHRDRLSRAGVEPRLTVDPDRPTGCVVVLVSADGRRSMYTDRGANARLDHLGLELLDGRDHLHVSGHALIEPASRAAVAALWQAAGKSGLTRSVDAPPAAVLREVGPAFLVGTEGADVIFASLAEGRVIGGGADGADEARDVVARLLDRYPTVVLKAGPEGAFVASRSAFIACPAPGGRVVDPVGTGDAFCAGFLARWLDCGDLAAACASATAASAAALATVGGRPERVPPAGPAAASWERLRAAARAASENAHAPYSGLGVGAAGVTGDGRVVAACNVENASYGLSLCAECGLVSALRAAGADRLVGVSVVAHDGEPLAPCGRCRQVLWENGGPEMLIDRGPATPPARLGDLLAGPFTSDELARRPAP